MSAAQMSLVRNQDVLWEASERYYGSNHYGIRPNYERVLGEMTSLASWLSPRQGQFFLAGS